MFESKLIIYTTHKINELREKHFDFLPRKYEK